MTGSPQERPLKHEGIAGRGLLPTEAIRVFAGSQHQSEPPARGDIWWTASSFQGPAGYEGLDRMPFVVLSHFDEADQSWIDAAPIWHDIDLANDLDLIFEPAHTTLDMPMRVQLRREVTLAWAQFEEKLGEVKAEGMALIDAALSGEADLSAFGLPYEGATDWRIKDDRWIARLVEKLQGPYFETLDRVAGAVANGGPETREQLVPLVLELDARLVELPAAESHEFALAAASGPQRKVIQLSSQEPRFDAYLAANAVRGVLELQIREIAASWIGYLKLLVGLKDGTRIASDPFLPRKGATVSFGAGRAVTPGQVDLNEIKAQVLRG